jgi:hypothetical protein
MTFWISGGDSMMIIEQKRTETAFTRAPTNKKEAKIRVSPARAVSNERWTDSEDDRKKSSSLIKE